MSTKSARVAPAPVNKCALPISEDRLLLLYGGDDGVLDDTERLMAKYDPNQDGVFSVSEVKNIIVDLIAEQEKVSRIVEQEATAFNDNRTSKTVLCLGHFGGLVLLCVFGAFIFQLFEQDNELELAKQYVADYKDLEANLAAYNFETLCDESGALEVAHNETKKLVWDMVPDPPSLEFLNWDIASSVFFTTTLISTIGYGTFAPATGGGKAFTIIFSIFGIIFFGYVLSLTSERVIELFNYAARKIQGKPDGSRLGLTNGLLILSVANFSYIFILAGLACMMSDWGFGTAFYFSFITFSTIGLGDESPGFDENYGQMYNGMRYFFFSVFTLIGMGLLSGLVAEAADYFEERASKLQSDLNKKAKNILIAETKMDAENKKNNTILTDEQKVERRHQLSGALAVKATPEASTTTRHLGDSSLNPGGLGILPTGKR